MLRVDAWVWGVRQRPAPRESTRPSARGERPPARLGTPAELPKGSRIGGLRHRTLGLPQVPDRTRRGAVSAGRTRLTSALSHARHTQSRLALELRGPLLVPVLLVASHTMPRDRCGPASRPRE